MYGLGVKGDDLAAFVRGSYDDQIAAGDSAVRISAFRSRKDWRSQIRRGFGGGAGLYNSRGWAKSVIVKRVGRGTYEVSDKATYSKGRSVRVSLSWVFDNAPTIRGRKNWTAVAIRGRAPLAPSGRRYMWPSEADAAGWELEIVPVMGKRFKLIMGRRGPRDAWSPLWFYIPPYRARKGLDLDGIHARHDAALDQTWGEEFDKLASKRARRRL